MRKLLPVRKADGDDLFWWHTRDPPMRGSKAVNEPPAVNDVIAERLAWPRDVLPEQAAILAKHCMPMADVYAATAATSVDPAIGAFATAERLEHRPVESVEGFRPGMLSE